MSVTGLCAICEAVEATHRCERCGTLVCDDHYDETLGLCTECAAEVRAGRGGRESEERDGRSDRPTDSVPDADDRYQM